MQSLPVIAPTPHLRRKDVAFGLIKYLSFYLHTNIHTEERACEHALRLDQLEKYTKQLIRGLFEATATKPFVGDGRYEYDVHIFLIHYLGSSTGSEMFCFRRIPVH